MSDLFRAQVVALQTNRLHGEVLVLPRFSHTVLLTALLLWVAAVVLWLVTASYASKETVFGWLEPSQGIARVYAEGEGLIKQVLVKEGDWVQEGQPLFAIDGERYLTSGERLDTRLLNEYQAQQTMLSEQLDHTTAIYQRRQRDTANQIAASKQDLSLLENQLATLDERIALNTKQADRESSLQKRGYISSTDIERTTTQTLGLRNDRQSLLREQVRLRNTIEKLTTELELFPSQSANDVNQLRARLSDTALKIAQVTGQNSFLIRASAAGVVNNLQGNAGQHVSTASRVPLVTIIPSDIKLTAHLLVPVRAAGFVQAGQPLKIRYDAFPYQKFGLYEGAVTSISSSVLMPNEVLNASIKVDEPVYQVTASLTQPTVQAYGKEVALKAGMTLSADVRLSERSLLQWLLEPIYTLRGRL